jgi:NNP family nitrate/nitrite transporter-like MFS transporter
MVIFTIGAFGGLGGFFPPLVLGVVKDSTGSYTLDIYILTAFAVMCLAINYLAFMRDSENGGMEAAVNA